MYSPSDQFWKYHPKSILRNLPEKNRTNIINTFEQKMYKDKVMAVREQQL